MKSDKHVEIAIVGAGIAGIATAYYLCRLHRKSSVLLIDSRSAMSYTTAQSGDNYRNWWPHPVMTAFTNSSIDLMEEIAAETANVFNMSRRGYALATRRENIDDLLEELYRGYSETDGELIRTRANGNASEYEPPAPSSWNTAPDGVDILSDRKLIQSVFPSLSENIAHVLHIRRAGEISGYHLGQYMLGYIREAGGKHLRGEVTNVYQENDFRLEVRTEDGRQLIAAEKFINAAGPFAARVAKMLDIDLPIDNVFQQKIAFADVCGVVPRESSFAIDLDEQTLAWADEDREMLAADPELEWLTKPIRGGCHCRPDGGDNNNRVKLGWAFNTTLSEAQEDLVNEPCLQDQFPEIVIRGAAALHPSLSAYIESLPAQRSHYGGYYSMTTENWPLIGPMGVDGAYMIAALSGFGSMAACAGGSLCAAWVIDAELPSYAASFSLARYQDPELMVVLANMANRGLL